MIGFSNLGDINTHLLQFQHALEKGSVSKAVSANTMLVFMVRGLFSNLEFPYAQFACSDVTGDLLFSLMWEVVSRRAMWFERFNIVTADGTSPNRHLSRIHNPSLTLTPHKVPNLYATDGRDFSSFLLNTFGKLVSHVKCYAYISEM